MLKDDIHNKIIARLEDVCQWFAEQRKDMFFPIYSSYDIRDSGFKVSTVDANIFPAGFNNICAVDQEEAGALAKKYLEANYPGGAKKVLLLGEEHTNNAYYWENVRTLKKIFEDSGREVLVGIPKEFDDVLEVKTSAGHTVKVCSAKRKNGNLN